MTYQIRQVPAELTYPLRRRVLRPHQTVDEMRLPGDDDASTGTYAAMTADGAVVATATVRPEPCPWWPERAEAWRLRGMATEPSLRGQGLGAQVLAAVVAHVARHGGRLLWCHARIPARAFYERAGFVPYGEEWDEPLIGPHVRMWRDVG